jgi:amidophosphoribosyltransferase
LRISTILLFLFFLFPVSAAIAEEGIGHECGVGLVRLRKPIEYYITKYQDVAWGTKKLLFLMEKQRNRGQDGAGIAVLKFHMPQGQEYIHQLRSASDNALDEIIAQVQRAFQDLEKKKLTDEMSVKQCCPFIGEAILGHVRYATYAGHELKLTQPFLRPHHFPCCNLALAGNFNLTNTADLFHELQNHGIASTCVSDTQAILDCIAYHLDETSIHKMRYEPGNLIAHSSSELVLPVVQPQLDIAQVLKEAAHEWDGGYVFCGLLGHGDVFAMRDPAGIRPGYYYIDDEVIAVASERAALVEAFDAPEEAISQLKPGYALVMEKNGEISESLIVSPLPERQCLFEKIYFSKASDPNIYFGRKILGCNLAKRVFDAVKGDMDHTLFTFVPNTSLSAFQGVIEEISRLSYESTLENIRKNIREANSTENQEELVYQQPRVEYIISKNQKLRTFISSKEIRKNLVSQLYDVTRGVVTPEDTLVIVDDSIVRGTTLRESLLPKLLQLKPKKIIIVSSAPPVLYPDCYGIDMSQLGSFIAFDAAVSLLKERGTETVLEEVKQLCMNQRNLPAQKLMNAVKKIYESLTLDEISAQVAKLIAPDSAVPIQVIYQTLEGLHDAFPEYTGDWYFSGDYPTSGGYKVLNNSFLLWCQKDDSRSY